TTAPDHRPPHAPPRAAGELGAARLQKTERRGVGVAPGCEGELEVIARVVRRRVEREAARRTVLETLIDRQNHETSGPGQAPVIRSEEHTSELQSPDHL